MVLSHLRGYKFKNRLHNTLNLICSCGNEIATVSHFFLQFPKFAHERLLLLTLFTVENFMSELFGHWRKRWLTVAISFPQLQINASFIRYNLIQINTSSLMHPS